ncbi:MAG: hypothetical protein PHP44_09190 [Kiritimatiellae bacterium]|nr:hypothetical protein [Kiritimatiellia bacterium]
MWIEDEETGKPVGGLVGSVDEPKPLDYREASDEINQQAREQLMEVIASSDYPSDQQELISTNGICGPLLWLKIQPYAAIRGLNWSPAYFRIPYIDPESGERCVQPAEGRILQSRTEMLEFWGALHYELNVTTNDVIRRLTQTEKDQLWAMTPFEYLEEPIFIIEGSDYRIMTLMIEEDGRYLPFWMDDFQLLSTNVTRGVTEDTP